MCTRMRINMETKYTEALKIMKTGKGTFRWPSNDACLLLRMSLILQIFKYLFFNEAQFVVLQIYCHLLCHGPHLAHFQQCSQVKDTARGLYYCFKLSYCCNSSCLPYSTCHVVFIYMFFNSLSCVMPIISDTDVS